MTVKINDKALDYLVLFDFLELFRRNAENIFSANCSFAYVQLSKLVGHAQHLAASPHCAVSS
jgi:hypothetical protein